MQTRYAKIGESHIAYRVFGDGPVDLLLFLGEYIPVDAIDEEPRYARVLRRLSSCGRVIAFNRRGVGLSDPPGGPVTQEQYVDDATVVLDDVQIERAVPFGWNVAGPAAIMFAARRKERTSALILANTAARYITAPDYPAGFPEEALALTAEQATSTDETEFDFLTEFAPSVATDERFRAWWDRAGHRGASPGRSRELWRLLLTTDVRSALEHVAVPTLVMSRSDVAGAGRGGHLSRYIADRITGARYVEFPGRDLLWWVGNSDDYLDQIETFLETTVGSAPRPRRALATVMLVDVVDSTQHAARLGDRRWRDVLDTYYDVVRREIDRVNGTLVGTEGDGVIATFDMPADGIRCAAAITKEVRGLEVDARAGVHTGEVETLGNDVAGIGVHIAARVKDAAGAGEVLVSRTVADLVTGSGIEFAERGERELRGVPGRWALYAVTS